MRRRTPTTDHVFRDRGLTDSNPRFRIEWCGTALELDDDFVSSYLFAELHTALGETDRAFKCLDKAYAEQPPYLLFLRVEPTVDPLRGDPRFELLLRRVGFPGQRP